MRPQNTLLVVLLLAGVASACSRGPDALYETAPYLRYGERPTVPLSTDSGSTGPLSTEPIVGLDAMVEVLLERSPAVAAARERYRATVAAVPAASRLPDLQVKLAWLPKPVETRVGPNTHRVGLEQAIPFPTKLIARDSIARADARRAALAYDAMVRDQLVTLSRVYADLVYAERALLVISENEAIAEAIAQLGASRSVENGAGLSDVVRAQAQLAQLDYDRVTITERRDLARAHINALLSRAVEAELEVEALPFAPVEREEEWLYATALLHQQELAMLDEGIAGAESQLSLAQSGWLPDLSVGGQIMFQDESQMLPLQPDSGEEAIALSVGLSVPLSFHANASATEAAEARLRATIHDKQAAIDGLQARLREALFKERNAARLHILYTDELLPRARTAMQSAEQAAQLDAGAYADLLEARAAYYSFTLARERALADHFQAVAELERVIGATLTPEVDQ